MPSIIDRLAQRPRRVPAASRPDAPSAHTIPASELGFTEHSPEKPEVAEAAGNAVLLALYRQRNPGRFGEQA